jgi:hypothetical protein
MPTLKGSLKVLKWKRGLEGVRNVEIAENFALLL